MTVNRNQAEQARFEDSVRQVARILWIDAALGGSLELDGRERDGVFETRDTVHVVEATVSLKQDKADEDAKKTAQSVQKLRSSGSKFAQGWFITQNEPTPDQKKAVEKYGHSVRILSFEQFRSMLFNGSEYLRCRINSTFGSISNPIDPAERVPRATYVPLELLDKAGGPRKDASAIAKAVRESTVRATLLGDYGAGKSMTLREIYLQLSDSYERLQGARVPIYLNLRDHRGQSDPVEALERHLRQIGYSGGASDLVRAWRSGSVDLILDGFDEIATAGWGQSLKKVREHRYAAMTLVRNFAQESASSSSLLIAGRSNFFDHQKELERALGLGSNWSHYTLNDFTPRQVENLLKKIGYRGHIPEWLPARPLIVAYFALLGQQDELHTDLEGLTAGAGWDRFLDMITEREARQDQRLDPLTVRAIIERLATKARATTDGMGRLSIDAVQSAYREIVGSLPDEGGQQLLLRLPGLASSSAEDGTRAFIDTQFASAARVGDVIRFVLDPFSFETEIFEDAQAAIGESGRDVFQHRRETLQISDGNLKAASESLRQRDPPRQLVMDVVASAIYTFDGDKFSGIEISDASEDEIHIRDEDLTKILFKDCIISYVNIEENSDRNLLPTFSSCLIAHLDGLGPSETTPANFSTSDITTFTAPSSTNADIMGLSLAEPVKVLLTILRKLFFQRGSGRQISAFHRGLDPKAAKYVPGVLELVSREGLATSVRLRGKEIWLPNRSLSGRIKHILSSPLTSDDDLLRLAKEL